VTDDAVVVVADTTLFEEARHAVCELQRHCRSGIEVFWFHHALTSSQLAAVRALPGVQLIDLDSVAVRDGPLERHEDPGKAPLYYARFECFGERFAAYDAVMYLDVDVIVRGDVSQVLRSDFAVAPDIDGRTPFEDPEDERLLALLAEDGWPGELAPVANAGGFVLGRRWRTPEQRALIDRIIERYGAFLRVGDQSVLNLWLHANGLTPEMDVAFNCQMARATLGRGSVRAVRDARVLHFNGLALGYQRLAIRMTRACLRVPIVGPLLAVSGFRVMFEGFGPRRWLRRTLRRTARMRAQVRATIAR
jgi:hypothetical protein